MSIFKNCFQSFDLKCISE